MEKFITFRLKHWLWSFPRPPYISNVAQLRPLILLLVFSSVFFEPLLSPAPWATRFGVPIVEAAEITYVYDDLSRLRAVVDPVSDTAVYNYDSVGNLVLFHVKAHP